MTNNNTYEAFPLYWPSGYKRTLPGNRINSLFKQTMDRAQQFLRSQLELMDATDLVVSTNIPIRKDGGMYTDWMNRKIDDPGVAIYFKYKKKDISMCCDQYRTIWENVYALGKGIEALRGMDRWGVSEFLERAFTGFKVLPEQTDAGIDCFTVLEITSTATQDEVKYAYRKLSAKYHPDNRETGNAEKFIIVQKAYEQALQTFKS